MLIERIKLTNLLSFGPDSPELELGPLNVLIGPNGSGKSNLIDAIGLLHATPGDLAAAIRDHRIVHDWIWKYEADTSRVASIEAVIPTPDMMARLRHRLRFSALAYHLQLVEECIENAVPSPDCTRSNAFFALLSDGQALLDYRDNNRHIKLPSEKLNQQQSVLAQHMGIERPSSLIWLGTLYGSIRMYRDWRIGRRTPLRLPQRPDLPNDYLLEDCSNLGLMLNRLARDISAKERFLDALKSIYEGVSDYHVNVEAGTVQVFLQEDRSLMPANRLSDGTLRYLCLLAILCHPNPPALVCIEEPELGLHPDIIPGLSKLLREASERCQLIVTTHSDVLVDSLTDTPESVVVCEKHDGQTSMKRLDKEELSHWLKDYRLGDLWSSGEIGGNRW